MVGPGDLAVVALLGAGNTLDLEETRVRLVLRVWIEVVEPEEPALVRGPLREPGHALVADRRRTDGQVGPSAVCQHELDVVELEALVQAVGAGHVHVTGDCRRGQACSSQALGQRLDSTRQPRVVQRTGVSRRMQGGQDRSHAGQRPGGRCIRSFEDRPCGSQLIDSWCGGAVVAVGTHVIRP